MNSTNVGSSKTSKKEVKSSVIDIRVVGKPKIVGGPLCILGKGKEYSMEMNPEYLLDFSEPMMDLAKSVGTYTGYIDENGKIAKRVDNKTGKKFNLNPESIKKAMKKEQKDVTDVAIVAIDDTTIRKAKQEFDKHKVSKVGQNR